MVRSSRLIAALIIGGVCLPLGSSALGQAVRIMPIPRPPVWVPPRPEPPPGYYYRWVPPVYRTVYDRVWVEETTQRICQWMEIAPGRWERVWTTTTIPAHWETTARRLLVSDGYWQLVQIAPPPQPIPLPYPVYRNPPTVGVDGYAQHGGEDLRKFSPLSEWPDRK
jgi:hypothetical protein